MHGTAIAGAHWVQLEFDAPVRVTRMVLDWETAYAEDYVIKGMRSDGTEVVLLDAAVDQSQRTEATSGQSPGVKQKLPLHVIHTWNTTDSLERYEGNGIKVLRIDIRKPFHSGWGVSLWKVDVYGYFETALAD